ncbi:MAG: class II aldolase [Xanthomonadales bacterium]|nr:class II aldolase/adducin family protein [Gammaproteobacteria bacterium]NNE04407.1 class II aldolase [Xanthomonadales bacterium]NNL95366.1 class II aldolase [Xanthomonadales bacterium]
MSVDYHGQLIDAALALNDSGINRGTAGNLSVRFEQGMLITPSGMDYADISAADLVAIGFDGRTRGRRKPSSEWRIHLDLYRAREDVAAIVHAHPPACAALACHSMPIPPFHYMVAVAGGKDIRCSGYATFGSQALSDEVLRAMEDRKACLMAHHGMIATGATPERALALAVEVETLAEMYSRCLAIGTPPLLSDEEMARVLEQFRDYGPAHGH